MREDPSPCRNKTELLTEMDRHSVDRALIYHAQAESLSPLQGNRYLEDWLDEAGRLSPQWLIMPTDESLQQIESLHSQGRVQTLRLFDTEPAGLPFRSWAYDELLSWLSVKHIPLWISLPNANIENIVTTLKDYPDLVTVMVGAQYRHALWIRPLLRNITNAYLEISRYEPIGELENLRDKFGSERLIYGSWYSCYAMGPILYYLHHTNFSDEELALVCAGNLERILKG